MPADLSSLMRVAPGTGAYMTGQAHNSDMASAEFDRRRIEQLIAASQQQESRANELQPLEVQGRQLGNQKLEADMPRVRAQAVLEDLKARAGQQTFQSDVQASIAKNEGDVDEVRAKKAKRVSEMFSTAGPIIESTPVPLRAGVLRQMLIDQGAKMDGDQGQKLMATLGDDPSTWGQKLMQLSEKIGAQAEMMSPTARNAKAVANINRQSSERVAAGHDATNLAIARERAAARGGQGGSLDAKIEVEIAKAKTPREKAEKLEDASFRAMKAGDEDKAKEYAMRAVQARQRAAEDYTNQGRATPRMDPASLGMQTTPAPTAEAPIGAGNAPAAPKQHSLAEVSAQYPGVPPAKLREAYKKKFGVDLK